MARGQKKDESAGAGVPAAAAPPAGDSLTVKTTELLFMRDNFISGLSHLESGVHELRRAYITQFNTLLPEGHPGRISINTIPFFQPNAALPGMVPGPAGAAPGGPAGAGMTGGIPGTGMLAPEANMKRKRKPHDPLAPKRALTSYFLFMQHNKPAIKVEHGDWTAQQISDESERRWSNISDEDRARYEYMYQVDLARYYKQKECYERGEAVPEISADEAKQLYAEHIKSGVPFKGRKGKKDQRRTEQPAGGGAGDESSSGDEAAAAESSSDEEPAAPAPPPKAAKRQKTAPASDPPAAGAAATGKPEKKSKAGRKPKADAAAAATPAPPAPVAPVAAESSPAQNKSGASKKGRKRKSQADES